jgi:hypothetical protein
MYYSLIIMSSIYVKLKKERIQLSRLATVMNVTRPTLYRYLNLYDQGEHSLIPNPALKVLNRLNQDNAINPDSLLPISHKSVSTLLRKPRLVKEQLIALIRNMDDSTHEALLIQLLEILKHTKSINLIALTSRLAMISGKNLPSGKLENEIEWLLDYILHKHEKQSVDKVYFK